MESINQQMLDASLNLHVWIINFREKSRSRQHPIYIWHFDEKRENFEALSETFKESPYLFMLPVPFTWTCQ